MAWEHPGALGNEKVRDLAESLQTGPFGSQLHADEYMEGGRPVVNPSNMQNAVIVPDDTCTVDRNTVDRLQRHTLECGDIVIARRGQLGRCAIVTEREAVVRDGKSKSEAEEKHN